jgi:hypothetical protein
MVSRTKVVVTGVSEENVMAALSHTRKHSEDRGNEQKAV